MKKAIFLFISFISTISAHSDFQVDIGYRRDHLRFDNGAPGINILSELTWREINTVQLRATYQWYSSGCITLFADGRIGKILGGENQDSDYARSNRQGEFSRSLAKINGLTADLLAGIGIMLQPCKSVMFIPQVGLSVRFMHLKNSQCRNIFYRNEGQLGPEVSWKEIPQEYLLQFPPDLTVVIYTPVLVTDFVGLGVRQQHKAFQISVTVRLHGGWYYANKNWCLRDDIKCWHDEALVWGVSANLEGNWCVGPQVNMVIGIGTEYFHTIIGRGKGIAFAPFEEVRFSQSFRAQWSTISAYIGLTHCF